jgi:hypothetical protein
MMDGADPLKIAAKVDRVDEAYWELPLRAAISIARFGPFSGAIRPRNAR